MAKKAKFNYKQFFIVGIIWSALYIGVFMRVLGILLETAIPEKIKTIFPKGFDFLSLSSYSNYFEFFKKGTITIVSFDTFLLFFFILFWIPIWLVAWWFLNKINWAKFKPKPKKSTVTKKVFELKENKPLYQMPRKMPSVVQATRYVAPKLPSQAEVVASGAKSHTNLVQMIRAIAGLAKKYQVEIFQHILLEGNRVPMAISTDARAVLIEIVNKKNVNWSVEFTDDVTAGGWYSESGVMERLAQDLIGASAALAKSEPNSEILSAIVVTDGRILNTKQAVDYFRSKGIFLIGFNNAEPKNELPDLASFLSAYFDLKPGEQDPAPHPVEKVPIKSKTAPATAPIEAEVKADVVSENNVDESSNSVDDDNIDNNLDVDDDTDIDDDVDVDEDVSEEDDEDEVFEFEDDEYNESADLNETSQFEDEESVSDDRRQLNAEEMARLQAEEKERIVQQHVREQAESIARIRAEAEARLQAKMAQERQQTQTHTVNTTQSNATMQSQGQGGQSTSKIRAPMPIKKPTDE